MKYTCPMHPEIRQDEPGVCPKCGMSLEPERVQLKPVENKEYKDIQRRFWIALVLSTPLLFLSMLPASNSGLWIQAVLASPVVWWSGWPLIERAWLSIKNLSLNMFTLIGLGVGVAYFYSLIVLLLPFASEVRIDLHVYFEAAAVITTLVLLGQLLELKARTQTSQALRHLLELAPTTARLVRADGKEEDIPVSAIAVGDYLRVRPGEKIPVDGKVKEGSSSVNQSLVTGESLPVSKEAEDSLIAGTINGSGAFVMRAERVGSDTLLSQIVEMVTQAQRTRAPIQRLADTVSAFFVPAVILIAILTATCWFLWGPDPKIPYALLNSIAVLIVACPCALGLATPMSIMMGTSRGAREGVLVKNAEAIETLEKIDTLVVDKTGTLTQGKPSLVDVHCIVSERQTRMLQLVASLERGSEHSLAEAIVEGAQSRGIALQSPKDFQSITGQGTRGTVDGHPVAIGNASLMSALGLETASLQTLTESHHNKGQTVMFVAIDGHLEGFVTVADSIKPTSKVAIAELQKQGVRVIMLTGDHRSTALAIANELGIKDVEAEILPDRKHAFVRDLQKQGHVVAMAGDGVNDAPALAQAHVGIAMGTGTAVAIESAGITLMSGDLNGIVRARRLSQATMTNIRQNLFLAFFYNALAIPVAAGVFYPAFGFLLNPMIASAAMAFSSVSVIMNALRLNTVKLSDAPSPHHEHHNHTPKPHCHQHKS